MPLKQGRQTAARSQNAEAAAHGDENAARELERHDHTSTTTHPFLDLRTEALGVVRVTLIRRPA
jgi:hypothetical protein